MDQIKESSVSVFAKKLYTLLHDASYHHLVTWNEDGTIFIIRDQATFQAQLFPNYFKNNHFNSFVRQLNMYGFRRISDGRKLRKQFVNSSSFIHPSFQKNRPDLLGFINRVSNRIKEGDKPIRAKATSPSARKTPRAANEVMKPYLSKLCPAPTTKEKVNSPSEIIVRSNTPYPIHNSSFNSPTEPDFPNFNGGSSFDSDHQRVHTTFQPSYVDYAGYSPSNEIQYEYNYLEPQTYTDATPYSEFKDSTEFFRLDNYLVNQQTLHLNLINQLQELASRSNY